MSRVVATGLWPVHVGAFLFTLGRRPTGSWLPFYFESLEVFYSDTNGNCYCYVHAYTDGYSNIHAYTYCNSDIYSNANGNCYSHSHNYGQSYGYANSNGASSNADGDAYGPAEVYPDAAAPSNAAAAPVACRTNWNR